MFDVFRNIVHLRPQAELIMKEQFSKHTSKPPQHVDTNVTNNNLHILHIIYKSKTSYTVEKNTKYVKP